MNTNLYINTGIRSFASVVIILALGMLAPCTSNATEEIFYGGLKRQQLVTSGASFEVSDNFPSSVDQTLSVKDVIWFSIDEDTLLKSATFTHWVVIKVEKYDVTGTTIIDRDTITLTVNFDPAEGKTYRYGDVYEFKGTHRFRVTIMNKSSSFPAFLRLEGKIIINRKYPFDCAESPELLQKDEADLINTNTNALQVGWLNMAGAEEYDLEWTFYDTLSPMITYASGTHANFDTIFRNNATRITTSHTWYDIPLTYPIGRIYWRARGVRYKNGIREQSTWTSLKSSPDELTVRKEWYWVAPHEQGLNWQMQSVFAEEGKKSQSVTYFDGSLRNRQKVVRSDAIDMIVASETIYDSLGRAAIQVMPAPVSFGTGVNDWTREIKYNASYSAAKDSTDYSADDFSFDSGDCNVATTNPAAEMDTLNSAVGRYYSANNPHKDRFMQKFTPASKGFPFSVTEYMPDGTGRIRRQGGVGNTFQLGSGHETKYFYSKPDQTELDQLFGNEAGYAAHYQKNAVMDPNGQLSVSYIDAHGRTIATALAGVAPMDGDSIRLAQLSNYVNATRVKKDLLDTLSNLRDGMSLTATYSLLVTNNGIRDSFIYTFYPGLELSIDSCLAEVRCYDCRYDLEISIVSECGEPIVNLTTSNFTDNEFNTLCNTLPDTIYRLFDLNPGLKIGQYQVTKTLKINQAALDNYVEDYLEHLTCLPTITTLQNTFKGDTSCNKTCGDCITELGSVDDFRTRYFEDFSSTTHADTTNADSLYYQAKLACAELCDEGDPSDCGIMYQLLLADIRPGGQYAEYDTLIESDPDGDFIYIESTDETSVFYLAMGDTEYPYQSVVDVGGTDANLYRDEFNQIDYITRQDSTKTRIDSLTINEFIAYFKPSWAKTLVKAHPEYCAYLCCKANSNPSWDSLFSLVTTYQQAVDSGYLPIDGLLENDPFFNDSLSIEFLETWNNYTSTAPGACSTPISLTEILISIVYCGGALPCDNGPGEGCTADDNIYWMLVKNQYLYDKTRRKKDKMRSGACLASIDPPNDFCKSSNELCFGKPECGLEEEDPNPYETKVSRIFEQQAPLIGEAAEDELFILLDSANMLLPGLCDTTCRGMADQWIQKLSFTCEAVAESSTEDLDALRERFIAVCTSGCDLDHPFGSVTTNGTATSFGDQNLQDALEAVFFSGADSSCNTGCNAKLIDFPGTFGVKQYVAPPQQILAKDSCRCLRLTSLEACWGDSLLIYINSTSNVQITSTQLEKLQDGCPPETCIYMDEAISLPPILECNTCKTLTQVKNEFTTFLAGCGDTATLELKNIVAGHLNQFFGLNRSFEEYSAFAVTGPQDRPTCRYLCPLSRFPEVQLDTACVSLELDAATFALANLSYENLLDSMRQVFVRNYLGKCLGSELVEKFEARIDQAEYHFTLYYYDQADNLVRTVPPAGFSPLTLSADLTAVSDHRDNPANTPKYPPHNLITRYWYNSLNQVVRDSTPDRGDSDYWYDALGRLVLSQNAKQRTLDDYTYSMYDFLGRVVETGRVRKTDPDGLATLGTVWDYETFSDWLTEGVVGTYEVTQSYYDEPILDLVTLLSPYFYEPYGSSGQTNLRNRIATVSFEKIKDGDTLTYDYATHYSYDVSGNVKQMVQDIPELDIDTDANHRFKRIAYGYDLVSGKVNYVFYQKDSVDQFIHHYVYDADNRVQFVETSRDSLLWERDANYEYYLHGPLGRTEIGERRVQGIDYAYTLQGWLKGVNASALSLASPNTADFNTRDMGRDGKSSNTGDFARNKNVSRDVVGFTLGYYFGDYRNISTGSSDQFELKYASNADFHLASPSLYNGNIRHAVYSIARLNEAFGYAQPEGFSYKYDQLNRLISQRERINYNLGSTYAWSNVSAERSHFREDVTYDPNGNIQTYLRHGNNSGNFVMDNLSYTYQSGTNKLTHIDDAQTNQSAYTGDLEDQASGNYDYDEIGNLVQDNRDSITAITWTNAQKIDSIAKTDRSIWFGYDAMQNRVVKHSKPNGSDLEKRTYYVRDAQGNVMATYSAWVQNDDGAITWDSLKLSEQHIYGSSRVGLALPGVKLFPEIPANPHACDSCLYPIFEGWKHYEISNHLGNVLAVITDRKRAGNLTGPDIEWFDADVVSAQQYYPFGMLMPGNASASLRRQYSLGGADYRFGFNGKEGDDEVKGDDNQVDFGARPYDSRSGRWLSVDPLAKDYTSMSTYSYAANNPVFFIDIDGRAIITPFANLLFDNKDADQRTQQVLAQTPAWKKALSSWDIGGKYDKLGIDLDFSTLPISAARQDVNGQTVTKEGVTAISVVVGDQIIPLDIYSGNGSDIDRYVVGVSLFVRMDAPHILQTAAHEVGTHAETLSEQISNVRNGSVDFASFQESYITLVNASNADPLGYQSQDHAKIGAGTAKTYNELVSGIIDVLMDSKDRMNRLENLYPARTIRNAPSYELVDRRKGYGPGESGEITRKPYTHEKVRDLRDREVSQYSPKE